MIPQVVKAKPVMTLATAQALISAIIGCLVAFNVWDPTNEQYVAISALFAAVALIFGKVVASNVFVPATVATVVEAAKVAEAEAHADAVAVAESFGVPAQNQNPQTIHPVVGPVGGRVDQ